jgi:membrane protein implicated in regulation of membrane protease activity
MTTPELVRMRRQTSSTDRFTEAHVNSSYRTIAKYVLFQLPELAVVCVLTIGARSWVGLPGWAAAGIIAVWLIKDAVMFPFVRIAYQASSSGGAAALVGARGTAQDALRPSGYVRISSELWRAELLSGARAVEPGDRIRVHAIRGLTLLVTPDESED